MAHDLFEVAMRTHVPENAILVFVASFFGVEPHNVVEDDKFWDAEFRDADLDGPRRLGVRVHHASAGLKTIAFFQANFEVPDRILGGFARELAQSFDAEAVIGDYRELPESHLQQLVFYPDGRVGEAVDAGEGVDEVEVLRVLSPKDSRFPPLADRPEAAHNGHGAR